MHILEAVNHLNSVTSNFNPRVGIILGTGLGGFVDNIEVVHSIPYEEIPNMPVSTVEGHAGRLIFGTIGGVKVVAMQGRFHYYEGYNMQQVTFPVRVLAKLAIDYLFVSNASGGINTSFCVGDLMIITDHINLLPNPLIGPNMAEFGPRFPDMHDCYAQAIRSKATAIAEREVICSNFVFNISINIVMRSWSFSLNTTMTITSPVEAVRMIILRIKPLCSRTL